MIIIKYYLFIDIINLLKLFIYWYNKFIKTIYQFNVIIEIYQRYYNLYSL